MGWPAAGRDGDARLVPMKVSGAGALLGPASIYLAANIANAAVPFALLPILTRHLTPSEYGVVAMFQVLTGFVAPFVGMNVHGAIHRRYYDRTETDVPVYVANGLLILLGSSTVVGAALFGLAPSLSKITALPAGWMWAVLATTVTQALVNFRLVLWQAQVRPVSYGAYQILQTLVNFSLSVWLVVGLDWGWRGRVVGVTAAFALFAAIGLISLALAGWIRPKLHRAYIANALRFGVPLIPHSLAAYAITATDKLFITNLVNVAETGIYLVAVQIAGILGLVVAAFAKAWTPWLYGRLREGGDSEGKVVRTIVAAIPIMVGAALLLAVVAPPALGVLVGQEFRRAGEFMFWLALGQAFNGAYLITAGLIFYSEKTHYLAITTGLAATLNIALSYPLTLRMGANGAAMATAVAFLLKFGLTFWLATRVLPLPWRTTFARRLRGRGGG